MKFGGTSVGSAESILKVKAIVEAVQEPVIVVVSALGGITDQLLNTSKLAAQGEYTYEKEYNQIVSRHIELVEAVIVDPAIRNYLLKQVVSLLDELENILKGVCLVRDLSQKTSDIIVSYGERLSSLIVSNVISGAQLFDAREFIKTEKQFKKHIVDFEVTNRLIRKIFAELPEISVVPGFISQDESTGDTSNLGRGGSDYTASILAAALDAHILEIWTDVDGFMTADPKIISSAYVIQDLSYIEAMELSNFGAKVIYPPTIFPVFHKSIPILIKNTFNPDSQGTYISKNNKNGGKSIKGISSIADTCLITVQGLGMVGVIGVNYRIFRALSKAGISVFMVSQASSENTTSFAVKNESEELSVKVLTEEFKLELAQGEINDIKSESGLATVAIVGENMKRTPGIAGKLFGTLGRSGISVIACAQGASETNISFVIDSRYLRKALNSIHDSFFLSEYQVLNIFLTGIGTVGSSLLEQIKLQQKTLIEHNGLKINIVGIADVDNMILDRKGINLDTYLDELRNNGQPTTPELLRDEILKMNIFNSVFVDCTASPKIAELYDDFLSNNISVVAANKIAASSEYENYYHLKETARKKGVKFLFETNVGAGLPIINTMNALINSGDKIVKLQAVLSGTVNYIFNAISEEIPLSKAIKMAQEARFSEPDPRIDLSGTDVIRKLVIISREAGCEVNQSDVEKHLFIPDKYFNGSLDDFWESIPELDAEFEQKRKQLEINGKRYRFVAEMDRGKCRVGLQEVDRSHPFYELEGSNNIIMITTERYDEFPMIIKGYGAGAAVTAAGVFADIISIANIR
ncbi:bifunctional aspartate kinase/homoserine dehydrogenase I [Bacteroidia bacterium]|nr:bifunctional aspartate kinase/homoserine dehydrogenase I [Bacteroidia bacterium]GHV71070.1 bifunctional aspartate kinase/homoserine dehydrogenase I [Bacteroidia bacterium]